MTSFYLDLLSLAYFLSHTAHSQTSAYYYQTASLTTSNTNERGANITILKDINVFNNAWNTEVTDQNGYHMLLNLNNSWGFNPNVISTLTLTMNGTTSTDGTKKNLILTFSVSNNQYFGIFLRIDNRSNNKIYPTANNPLAIGDIKSIVDADSLYRYTTRQRKASNGTNFKGMPPLNGNGAYPNAWPFIITIQNNPITDTVTVTLTNPSVLPFQQITQYMTSFTSNSGMQIYIAGDSPGEESIAITQFTLEYTYNFTMNPTNNPTLNPSISPSNMPTISPIQNPSNNPTNIPTNIPSQTPSQMPSETPTSKIPTASPTILPTTTVNPSVSPSKNPTSQFDTQSPSSIPSMIPTIAPTTTHNPFASPSRNPTSQFDTQTPSSVSEDPTAAPTSRPTRSPTKRPTVTPTSMPVKFTPTIAPTVRTCENWKLEISFMILKYIRIGDWEPVLQILCVNAFKQTILSLSSFIIWNNNWCINIEIEFEIESERRLRRTLLQNDLQIKTGSDIEVEGEFDVNNILYNDFFRDYNSTQFKIEYIRILSESIASTSDGISDFELEEEFKIDTNVKPTYAPNVFQTKNGKEDRMMTIAILFSCFGSICCVVIGITCLLFYKYEKKYESETYEILEAVSPIPVDGKSEQKLEEGFPKTIEMERTEKKVMGMHDKYKLNSQSEFEAHLTNNVVVDDIIMNDIIHNMVSDNEAKSDENSDEDVIDCDMEQYVMTPQ